MRVHYAMRHHDVRKGGPVNFVLFVTRFNNAHRVAVSALLNIRDCTILLAICYTPRFPHSADVMYGASLPPRGQFAGRHRLRAHSRRIARGEVNPCPKQGKREDGEIASHITSCTLAKVFTFHKVFAL